MTQRRVLLVDDSRAILAYETAALSGLYAIATAESVQAALSELEQQRPDAVLLDLSMPERDGDELLAIMKADPRWSKVPVIVVSSEQARAAACLEAGAVQFLAKPVSAGALRSAVDRALAEAERRAAEGSIGVLFATVGGFDFGVALDDVRAVVMQPRTERIEGPSGGASEAFEFHGERAILLDLASHLGVVHALPLVDRKLVLLDLSPGILAVPVDEVSDPAICPAADIEAAEPRADPRGVTFRFCVKREGKSSAPVIDAVALARVEP